MAFDLGGAVEHPDKLEKTTLSAVYLHTQVRRLAHQACGQRDSEVQILLGPPLCAFRDEVPETERLKTLDRAISPRTMAKMNAKRK